MNTRAWILATFVVAQAAGAMTVEITVQVYNPASAPKPEVRKALAGAGWILAQAGINVQWLDCGDPVRDGADLPGCRLRNDPGYFVVSILPEDPRGAGSADALGFADLAGPGNEAAVVYSHVVSKLKDNPPYTDSNLLGHVIAHELGHLLLRSGQHGDGIMKANWTREDFAAMSQQRLKFSLAESRKLGAMLPSNIAAAKSSAIRSH